MPRLSTIAAFGVALLAVTATLLSVDAKKKSKKKPHKSPFDKDRYEEQKALMKEIQDVYKEFPTSYTSF